MNSKKVAHIRDQFLGIPFLYFILKALGENHIVLSREIIHLDNLKFSDISFIKSKTQYNIVYTINKIFIRFLGFNHRPFTDIKSYKNMIINLPYTVDVIHAHMGMQGFYSMKLASNLRLPLVTTFYGADMSAVPNTKGWKRRYLELFNSSKFIVAEGPFMADQIIKLGCPNEKIRIIPLLIPVDNIPFRVKPNPIENDSKIKILMCANFFPKKGYFTGIKVIKELYDEFNIECSIIGAGPLENSIKKLILDLGLEQIITIQGKKTISEIYEIAKLSDVFFHPSETAPNLDSEGGAPTIISQMQAIGLPIISTTHADIPNVIPFENHFLGEERDVNNLISQFHKLLKIRDWSDIQRKGRNFVELYHSEKVVSKKYYDLYSEC